MTRISELYRRLTAGMGGGGVTLPVTYVKIFRKGDALPEAVVQFGDNPEALMCCQAVRHAALDEPVLLTLETIGCVAAAVTLGLVSQDSADPLPQPPRPYTDLMRSQSGLGEGFTPPSPRDFTSGRVYACRDAGKSEWGLFGPEDSGRFATVETARRAVAAMDAIQPPDTQAVFFYANGFEAVDLLPDVVVLSVRPVELTRLIQGYQFLTGEPVRSHMNPLRVVDADLIARPYLTGRINVSTYCLGARLMARFEADRLGMGIPMACMVPLVEGLERSRQGYPFERYPGAV